MIERIPGTKNGYLMKADATNEEFQKLLAERRPLKSIVVNESMYRHFEPKLLGRNLMTINNRVKNNEFYINSFR